MTTLPPGLIHATRNPDTTRVDMKVLIRLHESLNVAEFKPVRSWFVANLLQVDVSSVNRSLQHLEELGYVERGERCGNGNFSYRLTVPANGDHSPPPLMGAA
jgi:predicted transcriptional regulator